MGVSTRVELRLLDVSARQQAIEAAELRDSILRELSAGSPGVAAEVELVRSNQDAQDLGSVLLVLLQAPAIAAVARGIQVYLAKRSSSVRIETPHGHVVATGDAASGVDVKQALEALIVHANEQPSAE